MQDAFAYCAELVRTADRDRFLASLFAPADRRDDAGRDSPSCAFESPIRRSDLRDFFHRWGCVTYELRDERSR